MRVIAGSARSLPLKTIEGTDTRPTQDRIKETLFNMLQSDIPGCKFLDLYSGSGAIGIEALSRGAAKAVLVENSKKAVECIKDNLTFTKLADKADVMEMDVLSAINRLKGKDVFSIVSMDPPYSNDYERDVLAALRNSDIIDEDTIIIVEEKLDDDLDSADECVFDIYRVKKYKTNKHLFLRLKGSAD